MREKIRLLIIDNRIRRIYLLCFLLAVLMTIIISLSLSGLPPQVPIFYSLTWGEQQLAYSYWLFIFPGIALIFMIFNFIYSVLIFNAEAGDYFIPNVFAIFSLLIFILCLWDLVTIINLFL